MEPLTTISLSEVEANDLTGGEINWKKMHLLPRKQVPEKEISTR